MAKLYTGELSHRVVNHALQIHGGYGFMDEFPISRLYRDQKILEIGEGTNEVQRMVIAQHLGLSGRRRAGALGGSSRSTTGLSRSAVVQPPTAYSAPRSAKPARVARDRRRRPLAPAPGRVVVDLVRRLPHRVD